MGPIDLILSMFDKLFVASGVTAELVRGLGMEIVAAVALIKRAMGLGEWKVWTAAAVCSVMLGMLNFWGDWFALIVVSIFAFGVSAVLLKGAGKLGKKANTAMNKFGSNPSKG